MLRRLILLAAGTFLLAAAPIQAQAGMLADELYGRGTHAYFSGDFLKAHELLTAAVEGPANDPRPYYFRGLVYLRLGRPEEASLDFQKGSRFEMADSNLFYDVSKSLERVQGDARLTIEQYRVAARAAATKRAAAVRRARYEAVRGQEDRVLRRNVILTPQSADGKSSAAESETTEPESETDVENPFENSKATPKSSAKEAPLKASPPAEEADPFAGGHDPFGGGAPDKETPAEEAADEDDEEPAEEEPDAGDAEKDPFSDDADTAKEAPAKEAQPKEAQPKEASPKEASPKEAPAKDDAEADPFGGDSAPEKKAPAKEAPPKDDAEADPFAAGNEPSDADSTSTKEAPAESAPPKEAPPKEAPPKEAAPKEAAPKEAPAEDDASDPFASVSPEAAPSPGTEPPSKATGQTPVTRPTGGVAPVPAIPVSKGPVATKSSKSDAPATPGKTTPSTEEPEGGNPFINEFKR